jgi:cupin superfamily acireductone dioxygenase involved in methionine salvage
MKKVEIEVYKFDELSRRAKDKVLADMADINVDHGWWEDLIEDAKNVGLEVGEFKDVYSKIEINFIGMVKETLEAIVKNYGEETETWKLANGYLNEDLTNVEEDTDLYNEIKDELGDAYLRILSENYDYLTSTGSIIETIEANEYEFTKNGELFSI